MEEHGLSWGEGQIEFADKVGGQIDPVPPACLLRCHMTKTLNCQTLLCTACDNCCRVNKNRWKTGSNQVEPVFVYPDLTWLPVHVKRSGDTTDNPMHTTGTGIINIAHFHISKFIFKTGKNPVDAVRLSLFRSKEIKNTQFSTTICHWSRPRNHLTQN